MEKRFIGNDMSRLYDRVRREIGPDAVIVRTRTLNRDGAEPLIELIATNSTVPPEDRLDLDLQRTLLEKTAAHVGVEEQRRRFTVEDLEVMLGDTRAQEPPRLKKVASKNSEQQWLEDLKAAREAARRVNYDDDRIDDGVRPVLQQLPRVDRSGGRASSEAVRNALESSSLTEAAVRAVLANGRRAATAADAVVNALDSREVTFPALDETAVVMVLGPSGAGRTTALMKMALDCVDSGRNSVLVAADSVRMGAREQLHAFGDAAGLEVIDAYATHDLPQIAESVPAGTCLFVDAPAGAVDPDAMAGTTCYAYLALPSHWQPSAIERSLVAFEDQAFDGAILTFADLAADMAPVLSMVLESPLGLAFISRGRDVVEGMGDFDAAALAAGLFPTSSSEVAHGALVASA